MATPAFSARHIERTLVASVDDDPGKPTPDLLRLALRAAEQAVDIDLRHISQRLSGPPWYPDIWPGEHYRLLAALVKELSPRLVVEIGTATGLSALALREMLPADGVLRTFDIYPWESFPATVLRREDFADGRLEQVTADLSLPEIFNDFRDMISRTDLIFIDAAKDGQMEQRLLDLFNSVTFSRPPLLVFDDIKLWNMLGIWRRIERPKLDVTSFGHWSGTGLVEWR